jgi:hypothetical protein
MISNQGVVIYAFNSTFDYIASAAFAASQAKKHLGLPVTLVTNVPVELKEFDNVIVIPEEDKSVRQYRTPSGEILTTAWLNKSRTTAYHYSPYNQTLLIDSDYFMFNHSLSTMFDTNVNFACFDKVNDIMGNVTPVIRLAESSIPMQWATVIYFTKCPFAKAVFTFMEKIKQEWEYYSILYGFNGSTFRNDFALSIALQALSGYSTKNFSCLPGKLTTIFNDTRVINVDGNKVVCGNNEITYVINTNVHCMNKLDIDKFYA